MTNAFNIKTKKLVKLLSVLCLLFTINSCNENHENINAPNESDQMEGHELATFEFSNGSTLTFIEGREESDPIAIAFESNSGDNKDFFDFKKYSMLDVYLRLTNKNHPVPKVLVNLVESEENGRVSINREIVEKMDEPIVINIDKKPDDLLLDISKIQHGNIEKSVRTQDDFCTGRNDPGCCVNGEYWSTYICKGSKKTRKVAASTYNYKNDNPEGSIIRVEFRYKKVGGSWRSNIKRQHWTTRGNWTNYTLHTAKKRYRGTKRIGLVYGESASLRMAGYTTVYN